MGRELDRHLLRVVALTSAHPGALLRWASKEWRPARELLADLGRESGCTVVDPARLLHLAAADDTGWGAFRTRLSRAGLTPWSLVEVDEAVGQTCPSDAAPARWRATRTNRADRLPRKPWPAGRCWPGGRRDLGWLRRLLR